MTFFPFKFTIITDPHLQYFSVEDSINRFNDSLSFINNLENSDFTLILGDFCWKDDLFKLKQMLDRLEKPYYCTLGNNDMHQHNDYKEFLGFDDNFFFWHKNVLFISLISTINCLQNPKDHTGFISEMQFFWAEKTIKEQSAKAKPTHIVFFSHIPPINPHGSAFNSARLSQQPSRQLFSFCKDNFLRAAFFGHLHVEDFFIIDDVQFVVVPSITSNFVADETGKFSDYPIVPKRALCIVNVTSSSIDPKIEWI
jgi:predicted phosphodiesterase